MFRYTEILASCWLIVALTCQVTFTGAVVTETIGDLTFECPDRWVAARGECYLAVETVMTWDDARTSCMNANGSELVQANDVQYAEIVRPNAPTSHPDHLFWIGLNRIFDTDEDEAAWGNIGNYPLWKGLWNNNEPNFKVGGCVAGSNNSFWAVKDCDMKLPFMCQYPACLKGYFRCENGRGCLNPKWQCDGENDCGDNSDEKNCPSRCQFVIITGDKSSDRFQVTGLNNNRECVWTIEAPVGKRIRINLPAVTIEEMADFLQVWTGSSSLSLKTSTLLANMTGNLQPSTLFSSNNFIFIRLVMDDSIIKTAGFNVDWTTNIAELEQSRNLTSTTTWQELTSPFYGQFLILLNLDLEWTITSDNDVISVEFLEMDIPGSGSLTVRDGDTAALSDLTSVPNPSIYISRTRTIQIRMKTVMEYGKGFRLRYKKGCSLVISASEGIIQSPGFTQDADNRLYPNNVSCYWILNVTARGRGMTLRFTNFSLKSADTNSLLNSTDIVQVFINSSETAVHSEMGFTGNQLPGPVNSNEGIIKLKFITDQALTDTGFSAKFSIDCPKVKANVAEFTVLNVTSYSFETVVAVSCFNGYSFRQEEYRAQSQVMMTCLYGGQWDLERIPDCQVTYCGVPPAIVNGYIANATGVTYNKTARYECNSNFKKEGADVAVCSDSGNWTNIPSCISAACLSIGNLAFGLITSVAGNISNGQYGSVAKFVCNDGYELKGIQYSYCNGTAWSHKKMPQCIKLKCPSPVIRNSIALSPAVVEYGGILTVTCAFGFQLSHNRAVSCLSNQTFNDLPECIDINECQGSPQCSSNAEVCVNIPGTYRCDCKPGYMKPPSGNGPCTDINECNTNNGSCNQLCSNSQGSFQCQCYPGYDLYIRNGSNEIPLAPSETGLLAGDTYYINHTCVRKLCKKPQVPVNGMILTVKENFYFGEEILYICNVGYSFSGSTQNLTRVCNSSGLWTGVDPACTVMQCPGFPAVTRGQFKGSGRISFGEQVNLECQYTNTTYINKTIICGYKNDTLQLLGDSMTCPVIDCGPVANVLPNGASKSIFVSSTLFLDRPSFSFSCMPGYEARGQSEFGGMIVTCKENGRWSLGNLTCIGKTCTDPGTPGGTVQNATSYEIGQKVFYTCTRIGFQPDPLDPIECVYNNISGSASWNTSSRPVCKDITPPIFRDCNEDIYVDVMEQVVFGKSFNVTDNSGGIKQVTYNKAIWDRDVISVSTVLVVTATDFSDNNATCVKNISVKDRSLKPILTCPDYIVLDVMNASSATYNIRDFVNVSAGNIKTIIPSTATISYTTYLSNNMIEVTVVAENNFFTAKACTFLVSTRLSACFPEIILDDPHGNKTVSGLPPGGVNVTLMCADGYGYQDGRVTQIASCSMGGLWSPVLPLQTCIKYTNPYFQISITVDFRLNTLSGDCKDSHDSQLRTRNITFQNEFSRICGMQWTITTFTSITDASKIITAFSVDLNDLTVNNGTRTACVNYLRANLSSSLSTSIFDYGDLPCLGQTYTLNVEAAKVDESPGLTCDPDKTLTNTDRGSQCLPCAPGNYFGQSSCVSCPSGTYQDMYGQTTCKNCSDGYTPAPQKAYCQKLCPAGFTSTNGLPPCTPCPVDNYWNDSKSCLKCPSGYSTVDIEGAKDQQQCKAPCGPGTYSFTGYMPCMPCPMNFYQDETRGITCKPCPSNSTTLFIGSNSSSNCLQQDCNATVQCYGRGTCLYDEHSPVCSCFPGYYGNRCETPVHICDSQPCLNGGVCNRSAMYNEVQCSCPKDSKCSMGSIQNKTYGGDNYDGPKSGPQPSQAACEQVCLNYTACVALAYTGELCVIYTNLSLVTPKPNNESVMLYKNCDLLFVGNRCETDNINDCASNPCSQYGMCQNLVNGSKCLCPIYGNYQLPRCERSSNFCSSSPCQNGGTCQQFDTVRYECTCRPGFTGQNCETNFDNCKENPDGCLYGGMCNDGDNKYTCSCMNEFSGDHCSLSPNYCPGSCLRVSLCYNDFNNFTARCSCSDPYETIDSGKCQLMDSCRNIACANNGTCSNGRCMCKAGFTGFTCQHSIDDCLSNSCQNGGICIDGYLSYTCQCAKGYNGTNCEININDCVGNCTSNGSSSCVDQVDDYNCTCKLGYSGKNCEVNINDCASYPCQHGGVCTDLVNDYQCNCSDTVGWGGKDCSQPTNHCSSYPCKNNAFCYSVEDTFFCRCPGNTKGVTCETGLPVCNVVSNPCTNNGSCQENEGSANCSCQLVQDGRCLMDMRNNTFGGENYTPVPLVNSTKCIDLCLWNVTCGAAAFLITGGCVHYRERTFILTPVNDSTLYIKQCPSYQTGKACELVKDWCKLENGTSVCKNGGKCMSIEPLGYSCQCITGYSGMNCEIAANPCDSNPCKGSSTCRSTNTDYICQCPQGKPYVEMQCKNVSTNYDIVFDERMAKGTMLETAHRLEGSQMSVMMWFRFHSVGGNVSTNATLLYITGNKGEVRYRQPSNYGFHVNVTVDGVTVGNGITNTTLKLPEITTPSFLKNGNWHHFALTMSGKSASIVVNGIKTDASADYSLDLNLNTQVFIGLMYTGEMSQVTVWNSALSYSDILRYFGNVSYIPNGIMAQGWWSYVFHPGVSRQYPSQVKCDSCKPSQVDKTPPEVVCNKYPSAFTIPTITDRFVTLNALEQQNLRSKVNFTGYIVTSTLPQDATYPLGQYDAIFVVKDESGNYQDCRFPIYVKYYENCPLPKTDANLIKYMYKGIQVDSISAVKCTNTNYEPTAALPKYIPCGVLGVFDAKNPYMDKVLPSCGYKVMNNYRIDVQMQYQLQAQCSDLFLSALITNIMKKFNDNTTSGIIRQFCDNSTCSNVSVSGSCTNVNALIAIQIYLNRGFISFGQVNYTLTEATRIIALVERKFIFPNVADSKWLEDTVVISEKKICNPGNSFLDGACFECGKGMFSNNQTDLCEFCAIGTYQQFQGKDSCLPCNSSQTTRNIGSMAATDCVSVCPKGQYYKYNATTLMGSCQKCPRHFYQDEVGQSFCKPCAFKNVTAEEGANSTTQCQDDCNSGEEPATGSDAPCRKCGRGTYRTRGKDDNCQPCPAGSTTNGNGSISAADCNVMRCVPGEFISGDRCMPCPLDTYQPMDMPYSYTNCTPCNSSNNYGTRNVSSTNITDCKYFCSAGYENINGTCTPCRRGFYKDHSMRDARWEQCIPCSDINRTTDMEGSTSNNSCVIRRCVAGEFISSDQCTPCPLDTFQPMDMPYSNTSCTRCNITLGPNHGTTTVRSTHRTDCKLFCQAGYENISGTCTPCKRGFYKDHSMPETRWNFCVPCSNKNRTTDMEGSTSNSSCVVRRCVAGEFISSDRCTPCPLDTFQSMDMPYSNTNCTRCNITLGPNYGTMTERSTNTTDCKLFCQAGYENISGTCTPCKRGFYKDHSMPETRWGLCVLCSDKNRTTDMEGSTSNSSCVIRRCAAGEFISSDQCTSCPLDTFQPMDMPYSNTNCTACNVSTVGPNYGTMTVRSTNATDCKPVCLGGQQFDSATQKCVPCPMGYYKPAELRFDACLKCRENYTTSGDGQISNTSCNIRDCPKGTFIRGGDCIPCPYAMYQDLPRQNSCIGCGLNLNTSNTGAVSKNDCTIWCGPGQEGNINCTLCPEDKVKPDAGNGQCVSCNPNADYTANMNRTACNVLYCRMGYYNKSMTCIQCAPGTYKSERGNMACLNCPAGNTSMEGGIDCPLLHCVPGKTLAMNNQTCEECPKGSWKSVAGNMNCTPCDYNLTTESTGANSLDKCDTVVCGVGRYLNSSKKIGCENCPLGTYQDEIGQTTCKNCTDGNTTLDVGSDDPTDCVTFCVAGQQYNNTTRKCDPCPRGSYKVLGGNAQNGQIITCAQCPSGNTTLSAGSLRSEDCNLVICQPGSYRPDGHSSCHLCPIGQYQFASDQTKCLLCASNYTTSELGSTNNASCFPICQQGSYWNEKNSSCSFCPIGQYQFANGQIMCLSCAINYTTSAVGSTSNTSCFPICQQGSYWNEKNSSCSLCPIGQYQFASGQEMCLSCAINDTTSAVGSTSNISCIPICQQGSYWNEKNSSCSFCPIGQYQFASGQIMCLSCAINYTTSAVGSTSNTSCFPICQQGSYWNEKTSSCSLCPIGQYQFASGQTMCLSCANNYTTSAVGSTSNISCIRDCRSNGGQYYSIGICVPCPIGQYREPDPNFNKPQDGCIICVTNTSTVGTGSKSQEDCLQVDTKDRKESVIMSVSFSFNMTFTSNTPCSANNKGIIRKQIETVIYAQFKKKGQGLCRNSCGNIVVTILSTCGDKRRKRQAEKSLIVFSVDVQNVSAVLNETNGNQTVQRTAESVLFQTLQDPATYTVTIGPLTLTLENITVPNKTINCEAGQQRNTTVNSCESCPAGTKGELAGGTCEPCESGTYQNLTGQTKCIPCVEPNIYTQQIGSTSVSQCISICQQGSYWNEKNSSCSLCPIGQYQFASGQTMCLSCANNYTTSAVGSTSNISCIRDCRSNGGQYYSIGICVPCPIGQYREPDPNFNKPQDGCIICVTNTSTVGTGSKSQEDCLQVDTKDRKESVIMSVSFSFNMTFTSNTPCSANNKGIIRKQIETVIYAQFKKKGQGLCRNSCGNIVVTILSTCGDKRRKRQAEKSLIVFSVDVQNVSAVLNETNGNQTVQRTAESVLFQTLQDPATYTITIGNLALTLENITVPNKTINCEAGQQRNTTVNSCESCPSGTKGELAGGTCEPCESGTHQNLTGQTKCIPCVEPNIYTQQIGSTSVSQCKSKPVITNLTFTIRMTEMNFTDDLNNSSSVIYHTTKNKLVQTLDMLLRRFQGYLGASVLSFRRGSVKADAKVSVNWFGNISTIQAALNQSVSLGFIGLNETKIAVDSTYFISYIREGYTILDGINITNAGDINNGSSVAITCMTILVGNATPSITWKYNGNDINPVPGSRISISTITVDLETPQRINKRVLFNPIQSTDSDNTIESNILANSAVVERSLYCSQSIHCQKSTYECVVMDGNSSQTVMNKTVFVLSQPEVFIQPVTQTVDAGSTVSITCQVRNDVSITQMVWYRNGTEINSTNQLSEEKFSNGNTTNILTRTNIQYTTKYECRGNNAAGHGNTQQAMIYVALSGSHDETCKNETDKLGTKWSRTLQGTYDNKSCPTGKLGVAVRYCSQGGVWRDPSYDNCINEALLALQTLTDNIKNGLASNTVQDSLVNLTRVTNPDNETLQKAEVQVVSTVLDNIIQISSHIENISNFEVENFLEIASNVIDVKNSPSWQILINEDKEGASLILRNVEKYSIIKAKSTNSPDEPVKSFTKKNLYVEIGYNLLGDIKFPKTTANGSALNNSSISRFVLSQDALKNGNYTSYSGAYFNNVSGIVQKNVLRNGSIINTGDNLEINSAVLSLQLDPPPSSLSSPLTLTFKHFSANYSNPNCSFWMFNASGRGNGAWSGEGCKLVSTNDDTTVCQCNHLTNFAILMSPGKTPAMDQVSLSIISIIGCAISIFCLSVTMIAHLIVWRYVKSARSRLLMNLCAALIISYVIFLACIDRTENKNVCTAVAALLHYFYLSVFFLMLAFGIEIAVSVIYVFVTRSRIQWLLPIAWILPAVIVAISLGVTKLEGYGNKKFCWLSIEDGLIWSFVGPAALVILLNFVIIIVVFHRMFSSSAMMTKSDKAKAKTAVRSLCVLLPITGITWVFGILSVNEDLVVFQYLFAIINSLQGLLIFLSHCVFNHHLTEAIKQMNASRKRSQIRVSTTLKSSSHSSGPKTCDTLNKNQKNKASDLEASSTNSFLGSDRQMEKQVETYAKDDQLNNEYVESSTNIQDKRCGHNISRQDVKKSNILRDTKVRREKVRRELDQAQIATSSTTRPNANTSADIDAGDSKSFRELEPKRRSTETRARKAKDITRAKKHGKKKEHSLHYQYSAFDMVDMGPQIYHGSFENIAGYISYNPYGRVHAYGAQWMSTVNPIQFHQPQRQKSGKKML